MNDATPLSNTASTTAEAPLSRALAAFVDGFDLDKVPADVVARAKLNILDALGIGFASVGFDFADRLAAALREIGGAGEFPVIGMDLRLTQRDSAHLNGTLIHGLDYDDTHSGAVVHTSASALPTMLAAGLATGASGKRALGAFLIASEAASRIGAAANGGFHQRGFHPTGVVGAFGAAIGAGYLYGLSGEQLLDAQGIVLSQASASLEFLDDGAWTKRNHPAWASVCGQTAAMMAKHGYFGPRKPYEGRYGLFNLYMKDPAMADPAAITEGLGERWAMMEIAFKPYPACHFNHAFADATLALKQAHGLTPADVKSMTARIHADQSNVVCEPEANKKRPQNAYDAQFSVHYIMSASLARGQFTLDELEDEALSDPTILDLCSKAGYEIDPDSAYPKYYSGEVVIETTDGRRLSHREAINRGSADNPVSDQDIEAKFFANATRTVGRAQAERVQAAVMALETHDSLAPLSDALTGR